MVGQGWIWLSCWMKESHGLRTTQAVTQTEGYSLKSGSGPHCWRKQPHNSLNVERSNWSLYGAFFPMLQSLWCGKVLFRQLKEKPEHQHSYKTLHLQSALPARCGGRVLVGVTNQYLVLLEAHTMRGSFCLTLPRWPGTGGWVAQKPRVQPNTAELFHSEYPAPLEASCRQSYHMWTHDLGRSLNI